MDERGPIPEEFTPAAVKETVGLEALERLDIRVGTIRTVEEIPDSRTLVRLRVDLGDHERTILAGLKEERADPSELTGRQTLFVVNLSPKKMMGELSEGMLLDIGYADRLEPVLAVPERPMPPGARLG